MDIPDNPSRVAGFDELPSDHRECDHVWKWEKDWYGDPNVINGTADCSGWVCQECGSTDCEDDPPEDDETDYEIE